MVRLLQACRCAGAVGGGVPVVGGHGKQLLHGIAGQGQLGDGLHTAHKGEPLVGSVLHLVLVGVVVEDLFQPVEVAGGGHGVDQMSARAQHAAELCPGKRGKDVQQQVGPAIPHGGTKAAAHTESGLRQQPGRQAHGLFGEVEAHDGRFVPQCFVQVGVIAALAAASIHDVVVRQVSTEIRQCLHQRA